MKRLVYMLMHDMRESVREIPRGTRPYWFCIKLVLVGLRLLEQKGFIFSLGGIWPDVQTVWKFEEQGKNSRCPRKGRNGVLKWVFLFPPSSSKEVQSFAKGHTVNKWQKWGFEVMRNLKPVPLLLHYLMGCLCLQDGESGWHVAPLGGCHSHHCLFAWHPWPCSAQVCRPHMVAHALSTFNNITEPSCCLQECGMASQLTHKFFHVFVLLTGRY